ncbi:MAG TPA: hypothetical protein VN915_14650 [Elusimicrobiota bacterium]|nr:hypothetical protein [Elusimicrobiota bacterium]
MNLAAPARSGVLETDETWEGDVRVEGDVVVPEGRRLVLAPGCRLTFARPPRWACAVFRSAREGYPIEASQRELCDIVVLGRLEALGTPERPVALGADGAPWGGVLCLRSGRADLASASLSAGGDAALQTFDDARASLRDCSLCGTEIAVRALGRSLVEAAGGTIRAGRCAIQAGEGARVRLDGVELVDAPEGCSVWDGATLDATFCRFVRARERGVSVRDVAWARLRGCEWRETPVPGERRHPARLDIRPEPGR